MVALVEKHAKPQETAVHRLAARGKAAGVQLFMDHVSERWFATSSAVEGVIYPVSEFGCGCDYFARHGRCTHHAVYLDRFGTLPPTPGNTAAVDLRCGTCDGRAYQPRVTVDGRTIETPCTACKGRGTAHVTLAVIDLPGFDAVSPGTLRGASCATCGGDGFRLVSTGPLLSDWTADPCTECAGNGLIPAPSSDLAIAAA